MIHLTLNTGHSRVSPREEVSAEAIAACTPLLAAGEHAIPRIAGYRIAVPQPPVGGGWFGTIYAGTRPCISLAVARDEREADAIWPWIERHYLSLTELPGLRSADFAAPRRPAETPWVSAVTIGATPDEGYWMDDFDRCLAWAYLESQDA